METEYSPYMEMEREELLVILVYREEEGVNEMDKSTKIVLVAFLVSCVLFVGGGMYVLTRAIG